MIISNIGGGTGNQLFMYAAGRRLAHKWNAEFKLDITTYERDKHTPYTLNLFNVTETLATPEEIQRLKNFRQGTEIGTEKDAAAGKFMPEVLDYPDNVYLQGCWENEKYFADVADILRREFTLKNPLSAAAQRWKEKILSCECSVSMHFRHGDFIYLKEDIFALVPPDYYHECISRLKQQYKNFTVFVFSNNLKWCKENLRLDVPTEFVEGDGLQDVEELYLMSVCKHNIIANSTFSWWGAWLNQNPDKKVFVPIPSSIFGTKNTYRHFSAERNENSPLQTDRWIRVPFDLNRQLDIRPHPNLSLLVVVNNDFASLVESLNTMLGQRILFELVIVDNASSDGSGKILRQAVKTLDNVTLIRLQEKVQNGAAWNIALNAAQGHYVMFLKGNDRLLANALVIVYHMSRYFAADVVNSIAYLKEDAGGPVDIAGKKFTMKRSSVFQNLNGVFAGKLNKPTLLKILSQDENFFPIGTRLFSRNFLAENKIRFNEKIGADAENLFAVEAMFQTEKIIFLSSLFYVAP